MRNVFEEDYISINDAASDKKKKFVDLIGELKEDQTFLRILSSILKFSSGLIPILYAK